jgi:dTDP-4-amino-4,6-dideoxygalactose transaminase
MSKIPFNSFLNLNYSNSFEELFSDYDNFRNKIFSNKCFDLLKPEFPNADIYLTHSATGALEMIALLIDIKPGDEIILPSFTFVSTANAFVSKGAVPVFVDIREEDFNIDPDLVEKAITAKTKAIIAVHYAGSACQMDQLMEIANRHDLFLIEDAAMGFGCEFKGKSLGSIGHFGVISFDITKQITSVQGGLCIINDERFKKRAANVYHIGTNRLDFQNGVTSYYEWVDVGSKFQMNELGAVVLYEQLRVKEVIIKLRIQISRWYDLAFSEEIELHLTQIKRLNAVGMVHEYFIQLSNRENRDALSKYLLSNGIESLFHYIPLDDSEFARANGQVNRLKVSSQVSDTLLRLPYHLDLTREDVNRIVKAIYSFYYEE